MKKILIVEDELAYLTLMNTTLSKSYEVCQARNGREGLAQARKQHPDLILLDIKMPVMDGLAMLDELRQEPYGKSAKVILLTNLEPSERIIGKVVKDLPTYYWVKSDIQLRDLVEKVRELLEGTPQPLAA
jgi:CheY-like chemotaxis protein